MATWKKFEDLKAWQKARLLSKEIFDIFQKSPASKDFSLKDQILRSSGSVMDNIAEGFGRGGTREFVLFLGYCKGSASEVKSQLYRCLDRNYIEIKQFTTLYNETEEIEKIISGLIKYLNTVDHKGSKWKTKN